MKKYSILLSLVLSTLISTSIFPQDNPSTSRLRISDFYLCVGPSTSLSQSISLQDFRKLAPASDFLKNDFSAYSTNQNYMDWRSGGTFSAGIGLDISGRNGRELRFHPQLRVGFHYSKGTSLHNGFSYEESHPCDTLVSAQTGREYFVDTFSRTNYYLDYTSNRLSLDVACLLRSDPESRWTFYAGFGLRAGMTLNNTASIEQSLENGKEITNDDDSYSSILSSDYQNTAEEFILKPGFTCAAYVPIGIDFRTGRKEGFLNHLHLFLQMDPQITFQDVPELRTFSGTQFGQGFGIRFTGE